MDCEVKPEDIATVLRDFDRKKERDLNAVSSAKTMEVVSSIGVETPITVLVDIRQLLHQLVAESKTTNALLERQIESAEKHHREVLAYSQQISDTIRSTSLSAKSQIAVGSGTPPIERQVDSFYFRGDQISTGVAVIGCILMHIDSMVLRSLPAEVGDMDTTVMELILKSASSNSTAHVGLLNLPSFNSTETKYALNVISSPTQGRAVVCRTEHIADLVNTCPGIMNCVEEIRNRALECPGILSPLRYQRLGLVSYPYVSKEGALNMSNAARSRVAGSKVVVDRVRAMTEPQKKIYANEILSNKVKPMAAAKKASEYSSKKN